MTNQSDIVVQQATPQRSLDARCIEPPPVPPEQSRVQHQGATTSNQQQSNQTANAFDGAVQRFETFVSQVDAHSTSLLGKRRIALSAVIGLGLTIPFLILLAPFHGTYVGGLFLHRGLIPPVLVCLTLSAMASLALRALNLRRQQAFMNVDLLPAQSIYPEDVGTLHSHLDQMPKADDSLLMQRVKAGLAEFAARRNVRDVVTYLEQQADLAAHQVHASYGTLKLIVWVLPILGFVGTVLGISGAVGGFSGAINGAADLEIIKQSLGDVTTGLALAFDTTLLALLMSIVIVFPKGSLQHAEDAFLNEVDSYCRNNLCRKLQEQVGEKLPTAEELAQTMNGVLARQQRTWAAYCERTAKVMAKEIAAAWTAGQEQVRFANQEMVNNLRVSITGTSGDLKAVAKAVAALEKKHVDKVETTFAHMQNASAAICQQLNLVRPLCEGTRQDLQVLLDQHALFVDTNTEQIEQLSRTGARVTAGLENAAQRIAELDIVRLPPTTDQVLEALLENSIRLQAVLDRLEKRLDGASSVAENQKPHNGHGFVRRWFAGRPATARKVE